MSIKKHKKFIHIFLALISIISLGGINAFLIDKKTVDNKTIISNGSDFVITEPSYSESAAQNLSPGATIAKDPTITNTSSVPLWMFAKVTVPMKNITVTGNTDPALTELYSFNINSGWTKIQEPYVDGSNKVYLYYYNSIINQNEKTTPLFNSITFVDFSDATEFDLDNNGVLDDSERNFNINIEAMGIQSSCSSNPLTAYQIYVNQNK